MDFCRSKTLLSNLLRLTNENNYEIIISFLSTEEGFNDFSVSLRNNHTLSIIFLKNYLQKWIDSNTMTFFYSSSFQSFLINCSVNNEIKPNNMVHLADYFEILSNNYIVSLETLANLINMKIFILVDAIFRKYVTHPRSNKLFTEINTTIPMFFPVFKELFFNPAILHEINLEYQKIIEVAQNMASNVNCELIQPKGGVLEDNSFSYILSIFYSLVFQDIHPLFEDNADHFFKVFFILFDQNQQLINQIFDLFITKYPEFSNSQLIILTLSRFDSLDGLIVNTLTKTYASSKCFPNVILGFLKRNLKIEMDDDWLSNTRNFVKGNDIQRGFTHRLIGILPCNVFFFEGESMFFVATVLRFKNDKIISEAREIIQSEASLHPLDLAFSAFAYLLSVNDIFSCSISYIETDLRFICMKYLSNCLKSNDFEFYNKTMSLISSESLFNQSTRSILYFLDVDLLFHKTLSILTANLDEFSSDLLFRIVKNTKEFVCDGLYDSLTVIFMKINVISSLSLNYLFDIYTLLSITLRKFNLNLIETILNEEITDIYNFCFFYMSVIIQETSFKQEFVLYILSQEALWNVRELHQGLSCILISALKKGIIKKEQIDMISNRLDGYNKTFVLIKSGVLLDDAASAEEKYLINDELNFEHFNENFLQKKYARMVIKKLISDEALVKERNIDLCKIIVRNKANLEFTSYWYSISIYFDI